MTAAVYLNREKTAIVPEGSPEAAFRVHVRDADRLGLSPATPAVETKPVLEIETKPIRPAPDRRPSRRTGRGTSAKE